MQLRSAAVPGRSKVELTKAFDFHEGLRSPSVRLLLRPGTAALRLNRSG